MYTLMIVDDEQLERQALRFILNQQCPEINVVAEAGDGRGAIQMAEREKPDIILMDIRMPEVDGLSAAQSIKGMLPDTCIIMLTALDEFKYAKQAVAIGAIEYLLKPLRPEDLLCILRKVMRNVDEIRQKQQEEMTLRESVTTAMPFIKMAFAYDLINGHVMDFTQFNEKAGFLGLKVKPSVAIVVGIDDYKQLNGHETEMKKQILKQKIHQTICDVIGDLALVTPFSNDNLVVLLGFDKKNDGLAIKDNACKVVLDVKEAIASQLNISVTIGVGRHYDDPCEIYKSYQEALSAQRQRFYLGDDQIIHIDNVPYLNEGSFRYPFHCERTIVDKIRCGEGKQAKAALADLLDEIFQSKASIETVKACVLQLLIVLSRSAVEGGANLDQLTLINLDCISKLADCTNKEKIKSLMLDSIDNFINNMIEKRSSMNTRLVNKACEYIVKNCHNDLSLEEVAKVVHLSPFYFSRLFKKEKGHNFADFVTKVRIDRAKIMLQDPDNTVVRIAIAVGYHDASYFCRVFRRESGMTPNQYRSKLCKNRVM